MLDRTWLYSNADHMPHNNLLTLHEKCEKCPYSVLFCSTFPHIRTKYGQTLRISRYSVGMWENTGQKHSKYGHYSRILRDTIYLKYHN